MHQPPKLLRIFLEAHESAVVSVWEYDREKENQFQHFNLRINKLLRFRFHAISRAPRVSSLLL